MKHCHLKIEIFGIFITDIVKNVTITSSLLPPNIRSIPKILLLPFSCTNKYAYHYQIWLSTLLLSTSYTILNIKCLVHSPYTTVYTFKA